MYVVIVIKYDSKVIVAHGYNAEVHRFQLKLGGGGESNWWNHEPQNPDFRVRTAD